MVRSGSIRINKLIEPPTSNPLFACTTPKSLSIAKMLITSGVSVNALENGLTILHYVGDMRVAEFYLDNGFTQVHTEDGTGT